MRVHEFRAHTLSHIQMNLHKLSHTQYVQNINTVRSAHKHSTCMNTSITPTVSQPHTLSHTQYIQNTSTVHSSQKNSTYMHTSTTHTHSQSHTLTHTIYSRHRHSAFNSSHKHSTHMHTSTTHTHSQSHSIFKTQTQYILHTNKVHINTSISSASKSSPSGHPACVCVCVCVWGLFPKKEQLIIGLFSRKWPLKITHPVYLFATLYLTYGPAPIGSPFYSQLIIVIQL